MNDDEIPALSRGLAVMTLVLQAPEGLRYSEIKSFWPGLADSTLSRLLRSLESSGHLRRDERAHYRAGEAVEPWRRALSSQSPTLREQLDQLVHDVSAAANESAGVAALETDHLRFLSTHSLPDTVSIASPGGLLHFEEDHAASLAILGQLSPEVRRPLLAGRTSRIDSEAMFQAGWQTAICDRGLLLDEARARPGISRMAVPIRVEQKPAALFLCLTTASAHRDFERLSRVLFDQAEHWRSAFCSGATAAEEQ